MANWKKYTKAFGSDKELTAYVNLDEMVTAEAWSYSRNGEEKIGTLLHSGHLALAANEHASGTEYFQVYAAEPIDYFFPPLQVDKAVRKAEQPSRDTLKEDSER